MITKFKRVWNDTGVSEKWQMCILGWSIPLTENNIYNGYIIINVIN